MKIIIEEDNKKTELTIPENMIDSVKERNLHVFRDHITAGIEQIAKREGGIWYVKEERCNWCGKCCMDVPMGWPHGQDPDSGHCQHLVDDGGEIWRCHLGTDMPLACCKSEGEENECSIKWKKARQK